MIWIDKKAFKETYSVLKQKTNMKPIFADLKRFIEDRYSIKVLNIVYEKIKFKPNKNSYVYGKKYRLICYVSSYAEREKMQNRVDVQLDNFPNAHKMVNDIDIQNTILDNFYQLSKKYNFKINVKKEEIWVDYFYWFSTDYMSLIVSKVQKKLIEDVLSKYKIIANIWGIHTGTFGIVIFYDTDSNKLINLQNGISEEIKNEIYSKVKQLDEFDFYKEEYISFDSKENLDKNYKGSLYYYFK